MPIIEAVIIESVVSKVQLDINAPVDTHKVQRHVELADPADFVVAERSNPWVVKWECQ